MKSVATLPILAKFGVVNIAAKLTIDTLKSTVQVINITQSDLF